MTVEPATMEELDRVTDLWIALAEEQAEHGSHLTAAPNRALMRESLAQHIVNHTCLVDRTDQEAPGGGTVVGFVSFDLESDGLDRTVDRGVIKNLYVVPGERGHGRGSALLRAAESALAAADVDRIVLQAMAANDAARRFYEERGYEPHRITYERPPADGKDTRDEG